MGLQMENGRTFDCMNNRKIVKKDPDAILSSGKKCLGDESTSPKNIFEILKQLRPASRPLPKIDQRLQVKKNYARFRIKPGSDEDLRMENGNDSDLMAVAKSRKPTIQIRSSTSPTLNNADEKVVAAPVRNKMVEFNEGG